MADTSAVALRTRVARAARAGDREAEQVARGELVTLKLVRTMDEAEGRGVTLTAAQADMVCERAALLTGPPVRLPETTEERR